jgi:hypothetical protein
MKALRLLSSFLSLGIIPLAPAPASPATIPSNLFDGSLPDVGGLSTMLVGIANGGMSHQGRLVYYTSSGTTYTATQLDCAWYVFTAGSATTLTLDSAYNIVGKMNNPYVGMTFPLTISTNASTTIATPTLSDTAVTLAGTTSVTAAGGRWYAGKVTQITTTSGATVSSGTTFTSIAQVGSTNNYTVTLGTNTTSPTVGQAIYLNVTAGTLPSGWYPINKVTSATSFVIAAPPSSAAWTATAATVPGTAVAPNVYSPLLTIQGVAGTVLNIFTV